MSNLRAEVIGPLHRVIREKLTGALAPSVLEIENESPKHGLPASAEKHFRVVAVSELFADQSRIERHQAVHAVLAAELKSGEIHALSVQAFTMSEWRTRAGATHESPKCAHGAGIDKK